MAPDGSCAFALSHDDVDGPAHRWPADDDRWECPHEATHGEHCLFHADPAEKDDDAVVSALIERLDDRVGSDRDRQTKQFLGARFGDLDLSFAAVDAADNFPVDLRYCHVAGEFDCKHATFYEPFDCRGATVDGETCFEDARFYNDAWFEGTRFGDEVDLFDVQFDDDAHMAGITVEGSLSLDDATFQESLDLAGATVVGELDGDGVTVVDEADFEGITLESPACFDDAIFSDDVYLQSATLEAAVRFEGVQFDRDLIVRDLAGSGTLVDLTDASLTGGTFAWTVGQRLFDVTGATIGDVDLEPSGGPAFAGLHVEETYFDGFDFGEYMGGLAARDWRIHSSSHDEAGTSHCDDPATIENTYVEARNGAKEGGNDRVAAEFFMKEMRYRAEGHRRRLARADLPALRRVKAGLAWFANRLLDLTTGYGERPSRVVLVAIGIVVGFAFVFALIMPTVPFERPLGYLVISATSFVTLVLVGSHSIEDPVVHLVAEIEGFTGAFLIALFVFTLTRSINR